VAAAATSAELVAANTPPDDVLANARAVAAAARARAAEVQGG
jgi:hypothetical protein